jgi:DNA polymerase-3 subunit alpha
MPELMSKITRVKKQESDGQGSLFGDEPDHEETNVTIGNYDVDDFTLEEKLSFEKEFLGFYLTSHPHMETLSYLKHVVSHEIEFLEGEREGTIVKVGGIIETARKILTKKSNSEMAFLSIGDEKGISVECVVFPRVFEECKALLVNDTVVIIEGKLDTRNEKPSIIVNKVTPAKNVVS